MSIKIVNNPEKEQPVKFPIITKDEKNKHYITAQDAFGNYVSIQIETGYFQKAIPSYKCLSDYLKHNKEKIVEAELHIL